MKIIITTTILILLTALIYAQESDINRNCEYARFEIYFPDSLDNNCIDTALQIRICKYFIEKKNIQMNYMSIV